MCGISVRTRVYLKLFIRLLPGYTVFFVSLVALGTLYGNLIGIAFLFVAFVSLRYRYENSVTYHAENSRRCVALSILLFAIAGIPLIIFDIGVSLVSCIPIGIAITWLLYQFGIKNKLRRSASAERAFNLDSCTEEELVARCRQRFKRDVEYKIERAIKHFILKLPHEEIDVNPEQSKKERYRFRKILR